MTIFITSTNKCSFFHCRFTSQTHRQDTKKYISITREYILTIGTKTFIGHVHVMINLIQLLLFVMFVGFDKVHPN